MDGDTVPVILGSNDYYGVPFPLVLGDRFFHIYSTTTGFELDVFRWDEKNKTPTYEVKASQPINENIITNPTGIVTFNESEIGSFLYKFRPKPGVSNIFGKVPVDDEFEVRIDAQSIVVMRNNQDVATLFTHQFVGLPIGIQIFADGSSVIGADKLPDGMILTRS